MDKIFYAQQPTHKLNTQLYQYPGIQYQTIQYVTQNQIIPNQKQIKQSLNQQIYDQQYQKYIQPNQIQIQNPNVFNQQILQQQIIQPSIQPNFQGQNIQYPNQQHHHQKVEQYIQTKIPQKINNQQLIYPQTQQQIAQEIYYYYIWIDSNINNLENSGYAKKLAIKYPNISLFTNVADGIKYFKKIKFYITYIIISGSLFNEFISKLKTVINEISSVPKIIIFTSEITKAKIEKTELINNSFYNIGGIVVKFEDVLSFLNKNFYNKNLNFIRPLRREIIQAGGEFSFEILDNKKDLLGLIYLNDFYEKPEKKNV